MNRILLITPPFVQPNSPYPATAYLKGYLNRNGIQAEQEDLSVELLAKVFSSDFLKATFEAVPATADENITRIYALRDRYISTIDTVMRLLRGSSPELADLLCMPEFLPQAGRFSGIVDLGDYFGALGTADCAKYLSTLYLQDISDYIRATVSPHFEIVRYGEKIAVSLPSFEPLRLEIQKTDNLIDRAMKDILDGYIEKHKPGFVGFTIPFPGNLLSAVKCAAHIKATHPDIKTIAGGGYPTTELRSLRERTVFDYFDYIIIDDGEIALKNIISGKTLTDTFTREGFHKTEEKSHILHSERGCPDYGGLPHGRYFSLLETPNPMLRIWSDGRWNKMTLAHGCYWAKCSFCDTSLDYIGRYDGARANQLADWMDEVSEVTGSHGFHFTDEAAPPKIIKELSLELLRRGRRYVWWTNVRFDGAFTADLCRLMAAAGCIAVSGGLETASDRLLAKINKGITIETATIAMRNFLYSGIMAHGYLMYGLPTQTLQETVDSLEVVRQMFRAGLMESAYWHRYAMTVHSPSGCAPAEFGAEDYDGTLNPFANNEIEFRGKWNYDIDAVGTGLRAALANFMLGAGLEKKASNWFPFKAPATTVDNTLITDHLIKPDTSRMYEPSAKLIWLGSDARESEDSIVFETVSKTKRVKANSKEKRFIFEMIAASNGLSGDLTLAGAREIYERIVEGEMFLAYYHSKRWDALRECGLIQL